MKKICSVCGTVVVGTECCPYCGAAVVSKAVQAKLSQYQSEWHKAEGLLKVGRWAEAREMARKLTEQAPDEARLYLIQVEAITEGYTVYVSPETAAAEGLDALWNTLERLQSLTPKMRQYRRECQIYAREKAKQLKKDFVKGILFMALLILAALAIVVGYTYWIYLQGV